MSYYYNPYDGLYYYHIPYMPVIPGEIDVRQPIDLGTRWEEQEGQWRGVWTRRGNSNTFDARWTMAGEEDVTAVLTIDIQGNFVNIRRRNSSDGNNCNYTGTISRDGRTVSGNYTCNQGGGTWDAVISR